MPIRLTGQDTERGTFSQRHMVLHDAKTGQTVCPIQSLPDALAPLELHNSPLSELACMGFEYGYSQEAPETLVLWEAQFGDFVNSAQVIIDQFITSGLAKWGQTTPPDAAAATRLRGLGTGALLRAARAIPAGCRRGKHPRREPDDARAVLPPAAPPGAHRQAAPARDHDPEVAAAPAPSRQLDRRPGRGHALPPGAKRAGGAERAGHATGYVHRQDLLRPRRPPRSRGAHRPGSGAGGAAVSVPRGPDPRTDPLATRTCKRWCGCRRSLATPARAPTCSPG